MDVDALTPRRTRSRELYLEKHALLEEAVREKLVPLMLELGLLDLADYGELVIKITGGRIPHVDFITSHRVNLS